MAQTVEGSGVRAGARERNLLVILILERGRDQYPAPRSAPGKLCAEPLVC